MVASLAVVAPLHPRSTRTQPREAALSEVAASGRVKPSLTHLKEPTPGWAEVLLQGSPPTQEWGECKRRPLWPLPENQPLQHDSLGRSLHASGCAPAFGVAPSRATRRPRRHRCPRRSFGPLHSTHHTAREPPKVAPPADDENEEVVALSSHREFAGAFEDFLREVVQELQRCWVAEIIAAPHRAAIRDVMVFRRATVYGKAGRQSTSWHRLYCGIARLSVGTETVFASLSGLPGLVQAKSAVARDIDPRIYQGLPHKGQCDNKVFARM